MFSYVLYPVLVWSIGDPKPTIGQEPRSQVLQVEQAIARYQVSRTSSIRLGFDPAPWDFAAAAPAAPPSRSPQSISLLARTLGAEVVDIAKANLCRRAVELDCWHQVVRVGLPEVRGDTATAFLYTDERILGGEAGEITAQRLLLVREAGTWTVVRVLEVTRSIYGKPAPPHVGGWFGLGPLRSNQQMQLPSP